MLRPQNTEKVSGTCKSTVFLKKYGFVFISEKTQFYGRTRDCIWREAKSRISLGCSKSNLTTHTCVNVVKSRKGEMTGEEKKSSCINDSVHHAVICL